MQIRSHTLCVRPRHWLVWQDCQQLHWLSNFRSMSCIYILSSRLNSSINALICGPIWELKFCSQIKMDFRDLENLWGKRRTASAPKNANNNWEERAGGGVLELENKLLVANSTFASAAFAAVGVSVTVQGIFNFQIRSGKVASVSDYQCLYKHCRIYSVHIALDFATWTHWL